MVSLTKDKLAFKILFWESSNLLSLIEQDTPLPSWEQKASIMLPMGASLVEFKFEATSIKEKI